MSKRDKRILLIIGLIILIVVIFFGGLGIYHLVNQRPRHVNVSPTKVERHHPDLLHKYINHESQLSSTSYHPDSKIIPAKYAGSALVMDADSGTILYQKDPDQLRHIASVSKLMTLYLVEQKASKYNSWNQPVHIPNNLRGMSYDTKDGLGGFKFKRNHTYTVMDLFKASLIESSNNSAIALGEWVANGNNKNFIKMMNNQAKAWHLKAHFVSSSGLENDSLNKFHLISFGNKKSANMVSALDVGIIARHFLINYPRITNISKQSQGDVDHQPLNNVNELLPNGLFYDSRLHVDGLKTGFTPSSGLCYVGTAQMPNRDRIITVVLNDQQEFKDSVRLMDSTYGIKPRGNASVSNSNSNSNNKNQRKHIRHHNVKH